MEILKHEFLSIYSFIGKNITLDFRKLVFIEYYLVHSKELNATFHTLNNYKFSLKFSLKDISEEEVKQKITDAWCNS